MTGAAQGWQPIETVPKDGEPTLLWLRSPWDMFVSASWFEPWGTWIEGPLPGGSEVINGEIYGIGSQIPSHWMRPEPPA
jgi:hypothetical protein